MSPAHRMDRYTFFQFLLCIGTVWGHGRLLEPPQRSSMWRYGFKTPKNYNDNELNCGGFATMMETGGRCGPCGDPWSSPRENEAGGKYATGTIGRHYAAGQIINVTIELTSNHNGYFEFRLCPNNNPSKPVTHECLNRNILNIMGYGKRYVLDTKEYNLFMEFQLSLPPGLTCSQCVLQWKWRAAQNKGSNGKGGECFGCGPQEHFINCADVSIGSRSNPLPLNRPGQRGVYISKTGPKTNIIHTVKTTTPKPKQTEKVIYDPSVMEPPPGSYSEHYSHQNVNNYQNEIQTDRTRGQTSPQSYQTQRAPTSTKMTRPNYQKTKSTRRPLIPRPTSSRVQRMRSSNRVHPTYSSNRVRPSSSSNRVQPSYSSNRVQPPSSSNRVYPTSPSNNVYPMQSPNYVQPMSGQVSYESMLDSKNEITSLVLSYMSSLPMDAAMETGMVECSEGFSRPICKAVAMWNNNRPFDEWCSVLCPTGVCPAAICSCTCPRTSGNRQNAVRYSGVSSIMCRSMMQFGNPSMDQWCTSTCNSNPDNCPSDHCYCDGL